MGQWESRRTSFGAEADVYDAYRPAWPAETAAWLTGTEPEGPLHPPLEVLDLGAGTGKLTRTLSGLGHTVTAADPSEVMLAVLRRNLPAVEAHVARAEHLPFEDDSFDAVTVAQAWHWVDQERGPAECARVLRPGGVLGLGWHVQTLDEPWVDEYLHLIGDPDRESRRARAAEDLALPSLPVPFGPVTTATFELRTEVTPPALAHLTSSFSYVALRPDRNDVLQQVEQLGRREAGPDGIVALTYRTHCYRAHLVA
jgi:ubiquinone/menaquinone biosynthesis C-methylase UbiE